MAQKDYWQDKLSKREKAEEDRYFAERDRALIEQLRHQDQKSPPAEHKTGKETDTH